MFEEFRSVITGSGTDKSRLSREDYLQPGVKESIFLADERAQVYDLFEKYLIFSQKEQLYDCNIVSYQYLPCLQPRYDFVVIDEVQDLTNIQLYLIIRSLSEADNFISWSKVKTLYYRQNDIQASGELILILNTNYRNPPLVTEITNLISIPWNSSCLI
jgi:hypothetical protein